jgi:hypothetical protein
LENYFIADSSHADGVFGMTDELPTDTPALVC